MPKYGFEKREFQVGEYWLGQRSGSPAWYRCWFDASARQTRKASLGTTDFEQAKQLLTKWFIFNNTKNEEEKQDATIAEVLMFYWEKHGKNMRSSKAIKIALRHWLDFFEDISIEELQKYQLQEKFQQFLLQKGMKAVSADKVIKIGKAAFNMSWKHNIISHPPYIHLMPKSAMENVQPRGRPLSLSEIGRLFEASQHTPLHYFIIMMLATAGRPEAIRELNLDRCLLEDKVIILNPSGRKQTKKHRPEIKIPEAITPFLTSLENQYSKETYIVGLKETPASSVRTAWREARKRAQLDDQVNPYSLRHTMARWLRKEGVPAWEVSAQLGHKRKEMTITEVYAPHDPAYLLSSTKAIDAFFIQLRANCVPVDENLKL